MNTISEEIRIDAPKSQVWDILNDLAGVQNFSPDVRESYYVSEQKEGIDAARFCEFHNDMAVEEKVIDWEDGKSLTLSIDFISGMTPPLKNVAGKLSVREDASHTIMTMQLTYDTKLGMIGKAMNQVMKISYISIQILAVEFYILVVRIVIMHHIKFLTCKDK